jgi:hypothetical protein
MEIIWHYLVNQFLNATRTSYKKAFKLSNYHDAYLLKMKTENPGDPDWATLYDRYHLLHLSLVTAYNTWVAAGGQQEGQTLNLDQMLTLLITRMGTWDSMVQVVPGFEKGSANYTAIFPQGRKPFYTGGKTARVNAVAALAEAMGAYPALADVEALVSDFATQIGNARDTQEGAKGTTKGASLDVESKRVAAMTGQYQNLGFLIDKLTSTPEAIAPFFDLNVLRESSQVRFTGTLDPDETERVLIHTFAADDELRLEATAAPGTPAGTAIRLYLATTPGGTDSSPVAVEANAAPITIAAAQFGILDYATHRYLTAVNSNTIEVHYVIELE